MTKKKDGYPHGQPPSAKFRFITKDSYNKITKKILFLAIGTELLVVLLAYLEAGGDMGSTQVVSLLHALEQLLYIVKALHERELVPVYHLYRKVVHQV